MAGWLVAASRAPRGWSGAFDPTTWERNDSGQYLKIARHGYRMSTDCAGPTFPKDALPGKRLCGNVTWFAGYPALMRALSLTGLSTLAAGLVIAWLAWYLALLMIWLLSASQSPGVIADPLRWACLLLAAVFPGQVYFAAVFPVSLVAFGMLGSVYFATRARRRWPALATGVAAGSAYLASVALLPGLAAAFAVRPFRKYRTSITFAAAGLAAGVLAVLGYAQWAVGRWDAYFETERVEYRVGLHNPLPAVLARIEQLAQLARPGVGRVTAEQTTLVWLVLATAATCLAVAPLRSPRLPLSPSDVVLLLAAVTAWLIPYVAGGSLSVYRAEALVIVAVPLLRRAPLVALPPLIALATAVAWQMAPLFFGRVLV
ncbi:MAG TPA: hypothetical protein VHO67_17075 [Polyangia bacterium]|nr:hypothetical protein [Polyangia bacterium]